MAIESPAVAGGKVSFIVGWVLSGLIILMMGVMPIFMLVAKPDAMREGVVKHGYPPDVVNVIAALEISCTVIYAIPQTAVLGAILLTGYLGGAVATHVRVGEPQWYFAVIVSVVAWLGIFLRDRRLRALALLRR